jgi:hypothetical protein
MVFKQELLKALLLLHTLIIDAEIPRWCIIITATTTTRNIYFEYFVRLISYGHSTFYPPTSGR